MDLFHWDCHVINGHCFKEIFDSFDKAFSANRPTMILAETVKGKGVSFMENDVKWHHNVPTSNQIRIARNELRYKDDLD